jgi:transposase-like protein
MAGGRDVGEGRRQMRDGYRAIDQFGQVIDVFVSADETLRRHRFFEPAIGTTKLAPVEVVTDRAPTSPPVLDELLQRRGTTRPLRHHHVSRLTTVVSGEASSLRGLNQDPSARVIAAGTRSSRTFAVATMSRRSPSL